MAAKKQISPAVAVIVILVVVVILVGIGFLLWGRKPAPSAGEESMGGLKTKMTEMYKQMKKSGGGQF